MIHQSHFKTPGTINQTMAASLLRALMNIDALLL